MISADRQHKPGRTLPLTMAALWGAMMSWELNSGWEVLGGATASVVLLISLYIEFAKPALRKRRLKFPCKAYFHIRDLPKGELTYVIQDGNAHSVKSITLPSDSEVEIEIAYYPMIPFHVEETAFGIEGDMETKPEILEALTPFILKGELPVAPSFVDRHGNFHYRTTTTGRSVGSCYTKGFKLKTKSAGVYKAWLGFLTDEIDGSAHFEIRVEDSPATEMRCFMEGHWKCRMKPTRRLFRPSE